MRAGGAGLDARALAVLRERVARYAAADGAEGPPVRIGVRGADVVSWWPVGEARPLQQAVRDGALGPCGVLKALAAVGEQLLRRRALGGPGEWVHPDLDAARLYQDADGAVVVVGWGLYDPATVAAGDADARAFGGVLAQLLEDLEAAADGAPDPVVSCAFDDAYPELMALGLRAGASVGPPDATVDSAPRWPALRDRWVRLARSAQADPRCARDLPSLVHAVRRLARRCEGLPPQRVTRVA